MKPIYTPSEPDVIKNLWTFTVRWMSGDADAYENTAYESDSEEEFLRQYLLFKKILEFKQKYHNLFCDLRVGRNRLLGSSSRVVEEEKTALKELLGTAGTLYELFEINEIDPEPDVTYEGALASPDRIKDVFYYDATGKRFAITFE